MPDFPPNLPLAPADAERSRLRATALVSLGGALALMVLHLLPETAFRVLGIHPRAWAYAYTPATWVLVHGSWGHLFSNLGALVPLSAALVYLYQPIALRVGASIWLLGGVWVWLFAPEWTIHGGASGLVYGLAAFLFASGVIRRDRRALVIAAFVALFYGGMVWGVLPHEPGVSWQGHLFGALAGLLAAWVWRKEGLPLPPAYSWQLHDDDPNNEGLWNYRRHFPPPTPVSPDHSAANGTPVHDLPPDETP